MNLDNHGKKRLAAMKAALAAGLPLAGLLAGTAACAQGCAGPGPVMGRMPATEIREGQPPAPPPIETAVGPAEPDENDWVLMGDMVEAPFYDIPETDAPPPDAVPE